MATFEVHIGEVIHLVPEQKPGDPTPEVRSVFWRGDAADEDGARLAGWGAWDQKYGPGRQPVNALVEVTIVDG